MPSPEKHFTPQLIAPSSPIPRLTHGQLLSCCPWDKNSTVLRGPQPSLPISGTEPRDKPYFNNSQNHSRSESPDPTHRDEKAKTQRRRYASQVHMLSKVHMLPRLAPMIPKVNTPSRTYVLPRVNAVAAPWPTDNLHSSEGGAPSSP